MLTITVGAEELYDEESNEFITNGGFVLELEHSLVSLSKWESIFEKPFLSSVEKTTEESIGYIQCMILTPNIPDKLLNLLSEENLDAIRAYIDAAMTAAWIAEDQTAQRSREIITSDLIYYWMYTAQIPIEMQYWHLNRLFTQIKIYAAKNSNQKPKPMSAEQRRELNARRQEQFKSTG